MQERGEDFLPFIFYCKLSKQLWNRCDSWVGVNSSNYNQPLTNFQHFHILGLTKQNMFWKGM